MRKKEIFWFIGTIIIILILCLLLFGKSIFQPNSNINLNLHDTYFILASFHVVLYIGVLVFFGIYLIRVLSKNFKNIPANIILTVSTILLLILLNGASEMVDSFIHQSSGWTVYPPLSDLEDFELDEPQILPLENGVSKVSKLILVAQISLMTFLAYCGFRTGQNFKKT